MRREQLEQLSDAELKDLALREDIDLPKHFDKLKLVELLVEEYEERRMEKGELDNDPVKVEGMKYAISQDDEMETPDGIDYEIPLSYGVTRVIFMTRDPYWAFAYWEIDEETLEKIKDDAGFEGLLLRVHDVKLIDFNGTNSNFYFDIPVLLGDSKWYINVPHANSSYIIELMYSSRGEMVFIAKSNVIDTPREDISATIDESWVSENTDKIIDLIRKDFASFHPNSLGIPQRIISFVSSSFIPYDG